MASGSVLAVLPVMAGFMPGSNYPQWDVRNAQPIARFDPTTEEAMYFLMYLPPLYSGGGLTITGKWTASSATSGTMVFGTSLERQNSGGSDLDADDFAAESVTGAISIDATSGKEFEGSTTHTNGAQIDNAVVGDMVRIKVARKVNDSNDNGSGDMELRMLVVKEI